MRLGVELHALMKTGPHEWLSQRLERSTCTERRLYYQLSQCINCMPYRKKSSGVPSDACNLLQMYSSPMVSACTAPAANKFSSRAATHLPPTDARTAAVPCWMLQDSQVTAPVLSAALHPIGLRLSRRVVTSPDSSGRSMLDPAKQKSPEVRCTTRARQD